MNDEERTALEDWTSRLSTTLGIGDLAPDIDAVLDLAGVAARSVVRPAAPVTTFLVGLAAGRAVAAGVDPRQAFQEAVATAESLATG
jgi:hypothetical protein